MSETSMETVAVIGLGSMGWGAALSLIRAGYTVRGADIREPVLNRLKEEGGVPCRTAADAARGAGVVLIFVVNAEQTEDVVFGQTGVLDTLAPGSLIVSCATVPPAFAEQLGARVEAREMLLIDGPVSGGAAKAEAGEMVIMASGPAAAFDAAAGVFEAISGKVYRLGDDIGSGSRMKMINQLLAGVHIAVACEAVTLGVRAGIDPDQLYEVITECAGSSWMFENRVPHILAGDYAPKSAVDIFVKDLGIVLETGKALKFPLPIAAIAHQLFVMASA
ncbi:MAG: L-threonate dehydrogenase, partial [Methyloligellaceae bacterium]